jgi:hypothetical protein
MLHYTLKEEIKVEPVMAAAKEGRAKGVVTPESLF